ncbi:hypothetical protein HDE68_003867 [Pedobacter cryoconitis]|uniref:Uncharacterized protein n=1 Tax=Pedobacter cryoconitis TaxID=188932 RepID=A0A7W9E019_9SPHI|nr:hypothetical protein [Pedobacter cryoconitis]MBB5637942.1 hypothetical protein [Pedobacter cryoconitis]
MSVYLKYPRNIILTVLFVCFCLCSEAQELSKVNFRISSQTAAINSIVFTIGELNLQFDQKGGKLYMINRGYKRVPEWSDYMDEEYYDGITDGDKKGKIKSTGGVKIDYYDVFDGEKKGKIKSIGAVKIDYYDVFDGEKKGRIKSVGGNIIGYYDVFDGDKKGKIKSFGSIRIDYYDSFSSTGKKGKVSVIGQVKIDYYDNFGPSARMGKIKSIKGNTPDLYVTIDRGNSTLSDDND